ICFSTEKHRYPLKEFLEKYVVETNTAPNSYPKVVIVSGCYLGTPYKKNPEDKIKSGKNDKENKDDKDNEEPELPQLFTDEKTIRKDYEKEVKELADFLSKELKGTLVIVIGGSKVHFATNSIEIR